MASPYANKSPSLFIKTGKLNFSSSIGPSATPPRKAGRLARSPIIPEVYSTGPGNAKLIADGGVFNFALTCENPLTMLFKHLFFCYRVQRVCKRLGDQIKEPDEFDN